MEVKKGDEQQLFQLISANGNAQQLKILFTFFNSNKIHLIKPHCGKQDCPITAGNLKYKQLCLSNQTFCVFYDEKN